MWRNVNTSHSLEIQNICFSFKLRNLLRFNLEVVDLLLFDKNSVFLLNCCLAVSTPTLPRFSVPRFLLSQVSRALQPGQTPSCFLHYKQLLWGKAIFIYWAGDSTGLKSTKILCCVPDISSVLLRGWDPKAGSGLISVSPCGFCWLQCSVKYPQMCCFWFWSLVVHFLPFYKAAESSCAGFPHGIRKWMACKNSKSINWMVFCGGKKLLSVQKHTCNLNLTNCL